MFETFCLRIAGKRFLKWWQFNNTKFKGPEIEPSLDARKWFWARRISCFLPSTSSQLPFPSHPSDASESLPLICSTRFDEKPWARACCFSWTRCLKEKVSPYRRVRWNPYGKGQQYTCSSKGRIVMSFLNKWISHCVWRTTVSPCQMIIPRSW